MPTLEWLNKKEAVKTADKVPYKLLNIKPELSYGEQNGNMIIKGDNLEALKALLPYYKGQVKCIYIDPPYNTGSAFEHYDDNLEHSTWLSMMYPRLELLRELLAENGSIWISIDDDEQAYLKVICDEIFGRKNFVNIVSVNMKNIAGASGGGEDKRLKKNCEYTLVYAKNYCFLPQFKNAFDYTEIWELIETYKKNNVSWKYNSVLLDSGEKEYIGSTSDGEANEIKIYKRNNPMIVSVKQLSINQNLTEKQVYYKYGHKIFQTAMPQSSIRTRVMKRVSELHVNSDIYSIEYIPRSGRNKGKLYEQFYKRDSFRLFAWLKDVSDEINGILYKKTLQGTYWDFVAGTKNLSKEGDVVFPNGKKPETLIERIFDMCTNSNELVLDSFLGSGTTAAVAQKMGRRYIGIEMGRHAITHAAPRLKKVIDGEQGGISKSVNWQGGGGFTFYDLGESIFDEKGNINKQIDFESLAFHIWFSETKMAMREHKKSPLLGVFNNTVYYLLYNGILGDKKVNGGNVLTSKIIETLPKPDNKKHNKVIYGEACRLSLDRLRKENITFKQTPYDIKAG
ncbi:MAG: site-specific DNA-methyltransferase [Endomicrobium sp.]|jgi:adenine-specific DNA-methyltransferase|nr:site-specific DNA-methyltransferase [Endomicrobium sp.]